jgi:hypothetical protein
MKKWMKLSFTMYIGILLSACAGVGGYWMNGDPSVGRNIKPYLHYWEKAGVMAEQRLADGTACGGGYREPNMPSFSKEAISVARLAGEKDDNQAYSRLFHDWERCMLKKGYHYTGKCDNETPACGAP